MREGQPRGFEVNQAEKSKDAPSPSDIAEMKAAYIGHIKKTTEKEYTKIGSLKVATGQEHTAGGYGDWGGYNKLVRLASTSEDQWNRADRANEDFPGWKQEDFAKLVEAINQDPTFQELLEKRKPVEPIAERSASKSLEEMLKTLAKAPASEKESLWEGIRKEAEVNPKFILSADGLVLFGGIRLHDALTRLEQAGTPIELDDETLSGLIEALEERGDEISAEFVYRIKDLTGTGTSKYKFPLKK